MNIPMNAPLAPDKIAVAIHYGPPVPGFPGPTPNGYMVDFPIPPEDCMIQFRDVSTPFPVPPGWDVVGSVDPINNPVTGYIPARYIIRKR
jgi:hypothetical protein